MPAPVPPYDAAPGFDLANLMKSDSVWISDLLLTAKHRRSRRDITEAGSKPVMSIVMAGKQDRAQDKRVLNEQDCRAVRRRARRNLGAD